MQHANFKPTGQWGRRWRQNRLVKVLNPDINPAPLFVGRNLVIRAVCLDIRRKITDLDTLDIIISRLLGIPLEQIAEVYGVSKQAVLYHENKDEMLKLHSIVLQRAAEKLGDAVGEIMLEKLQAAQGDLPERGALARVARGNTEDTEDADD